VGNLGSDQRFDYSVLGDDANVASRLEGQTKTYYVDIIVGERTADQVPDFALLELDLIQVLGKTKPVRIFFLLGDGSVAATAAFSALAAAHDSMIVAYRRREWDEALGQLDACRSQAPDILQHVYALSAVAVLAAKVSLPFSFDRWTPIAASAATKRFGAAAKSKKQADEHCPPGGTNRGNPARLITPASVSASTNPPPGLSTTMPA